MAEGMATPRPRPLSANHAAAKPVPLPTVVKAPTTRPTAITANPAATMDLAPASGSPGRPAAFRRGLCSRVPPIMPASIPPTSGSIRSPLPSALSPRTSWKYCGMTNKMPNIANDTSVARIVPQVNPADRKSPSSISGRTARAGSGAPASVASRSPRRVSMRSHATNPASSTTPAAMVAIAGASLQPS